MSRRWWIWADLLAAAVLLLPALVMWVRSSGYGPWCAAIGGVLDIRLVNYLLEYGYQYLGDPEAFPDGFWSPPFFYPVENVLAYSETFLAAYPFYIPLRWAGASPASAVFVYHLLQRALTPLVAYACLRWVRFGRWPAFVAAALFSWGWIRYVHFGHVQFAAGYSIPLFFTALYALIFRRRAWALVLVCWSFVFTWYTSLYTAVFLVLGTLACGIGLLLVPAGWRRVRVGLRWSLRFVRHHPRQAVAIAALVGTAVALLLPSVGVYLRAYGEFGPAREAEVRLYWADIYTWIRPPARHPVLGELNAWFPPARYGEQTKFLGLLAVIGLALPWLASLVLRRRVGRWVSQPVVVASVAGLGLIFLFSSYASLGLDWMERPFWMMQQHFPGLGGLRAPSRIAFVVSWFAAVCVAALLHRFSIGGRGGVLRGGCLVAALLGGALLVEGVAPPAVVVNRCKEEAVWERTSDHLCAQVPLAEVGTVLFLPMDIQSVGDVRQNSLAMMPSQRCSLRVVNGYSGRRPELFVPLLGAPHKELPCDALRRVVDRVHERSARGLLVHLDQGRPKGKAGYPEAAVAECLAPCLRPTPAWAVPEPSRSARLWVSDPTRACEPPPPVPGRATAGSDPVVAPGEGPG